MEMTRGRRLAVRIGVHYDVCDAKGESGAGMGYACEEVSQSVIMHGDERSERNDTEGVRESESQKKKQLRLLATKRKARPSDDNITY